MPYVKLTADNQNTFPHYLGIAVDPKPTEGIRVGEYLKETDTNVLYQWDGEDWNRVTEIASQAEANALVFQVESLNQGAEIIRLLTKIAS